MPNSGMLDHVGFRATERRHTYVHWMDAWPTKVGYQTPRTFKVSEFSRHMIKQSKRELTLQGKSGPRLTDGNSIAPFHTAMKPTCGYFFDREVDNRRKRFGVPAADIVAWRSVRAPYSRAMVAG